jgi:uncharacterized protein (TIGR02652 family)
MMINLSFQYPIFGSEIQCPHCRQVIQALTLTDSYLCDRHGAFEANPETEELIHLQSDRRWKRCENKWYQQHNNPDGIRFEIHEALDRVYIESFNVTKIIIAQRYQHFITPYLQSETLDDSDNESKRLKLYGIPVEFSPPNSDDVSWQIINFILEKKPGIPSDSPSIRFYE